MVNFKSERSNFGRSFLSPSQFKSFRFYYRFPEGEAGLDVYNRVTSFIGTLFRSISCLISSTSSLFPRDWAKLDPELEEKMTVVVSSYLSFFPIPFS